MVDGNAIASFSDLVDLLDGASLDTMMRGAPSPAAHWTLSVVAFTPRASAWATW